MLLLDSELRMDIGSPKPPCPLIASVEFLRALGHLSNVGSKTCNSTHPTEYRPSFALG